MSITPYQNTSSSFIPDMCAEKEIHGLTARQWSVLAGQIKERAMDLKWEKPFISWTHHQHLKNWFKSYQFTKLDRDLFCKNFSENDCLSNAYSNILNIIKELMEHTDRLWRNLYIQYGNDREKCPHSFNETTTLKGFPYHGILNADWNNIYDRLIVYKNQIKEIEKPSEYVNKYFIPDLTENLKFSPINKLIEFLMQLAESDHPSNNEFFYRVCNTLVDSHYPLSINETVLEMPSKVIVELSNILELGFDGICENSPVSLESEKNQESIEFNFLYLLPLMGMILGFIAYGLKKCCNTGKKDHQKNLQKDQKPRQTLGNDVLELLPKELQTPEFLA